MGLNRYKERRDGARRPGPFFVKGTFERNPHKKAIFVNLVVVISVCLRGTICISNFFQLGVCDYVICRIHKSKSMYDRSMFRVCSRMEGGLLSEECRWKWPAGDEDNDEEGLDVHHK